MAIGALRAAGFAAAALGYHVWRLFTKQVSEALSDESDEGLRSHPLGPEVELSSFSGNSSLAVPSSLRDSEPSPALTPLPEQLEPEDSDPSQHALQQWSAAPHSSHRQPKRVHEYELSPMDHQDGPEHLPRSTPAAGLHTQSNASASVTDDQQHEGGGPVSHADHRQQIHPLGESATFHTPDSTLNSAASDSQPSTGHQLRSHEAILDDMFPSIRKITPVGSEDEDDSAQASRQPSLPPASQSQQDPPSTSNAQHGAGSCVSSEPQPDNLQHPSARRLARVNTTVSRASSPERPQPLPSSAADLLQNGHPLDERTHRPSTSQAASTSSALSQLLHSDTQPSTGTPMARDLTEALTALASDKRFMQASRSFSSPDLLSLAQQLHDSGQWPIVQEEQEEQESDQAEQPGNEQRSGVNASYGTIVGKPHEQSAEHEDHITSPVSPTLLESHRNGRMALESLKRAREVLETPLALRLDVLAGPAQNQSYTTDPGVTQVTVGRLDDNTLPVPDTEVSGHHVIIRWDTSERCWQVTDTGSLNGTFLNGKTISTNNRKQGREHRLSSDDMMQLGSYSKLRVSYLPLDMLDHDMPVHPKKVHTPPSSHHSSPNEEKTDTTIPAASSPDVGTQTIFSSSLRLEACAVSQTGREHQRRRQGCEDVAYWEVPLPSSQEGTSLFCIFDGHCGRYAAREARDLLPKILVNSLANVSDDLHDGQGADGIWEQVFLSTDDQIKSEEGCTATALLVWKDSQRNVCLQAANVGDSAVVFCDGMQKDGVQLTADHRLTNPEERQRLAGMGIHLGQDRTRLYGLNLSRCLGDKFLKDEDLGLSAHPHISQVIKIAPHQNGTVVMASDGLWDVADAHRVLQVISRAAREPNHSVKELTEAVVQHAQRQRTRDDLTVILLKVKAADRDSSFA